MSNIHAPLEHLYVMDEDNRPIKPASLKEWSNLMVDIERRKVDFWILPGKWEVTTVFVGINKDVVTMQPPRLFETLVRPIGESVLKNAEIKATYETWEDAEKGHRLIVEALVRVESEGDSHV